MTPHDEGARVKERLRDVMGGCVCGDPEYCDDCADYFWTLARIEALEAEREDLRADNEGLALDRMKMEAKLARLERDVKIARKKIEAVERMPFCPDHRDKLHGQPCRECEIEALEAERDSYRGALEEAGEIEVRLKAKLARLERERDKGIKGWAGVPPDSYPQWWFVPDEAGSDTLIPDPKRPATLILHDTTDEEEG